MNDPTPLPDQPPATVRSDEPITLAEGVRGFVLAVIAVLQAFEITNMTEAQVGVLLGLVIAGSVVLSVWARRRSMPLRKVAMTVDEALELRQARSRGEIH